LPERDREETMPALRMTLCAFVIALIAGPLRAAPVDDAMNKLADEAAKTGDIVWYESTPDDQADKIVAAFQKRFPKLKLEHIRDTGGNSIGGRVVQESQGDTRTADLITTGPAILLPLLDRKLIKLIDWRGYGMSDQLAPTQAGVVTTAVYYVIVYNTSLVNEADAPKTWDDLLNPRWDSKIGIWVRGEGQGSLAAVWGLDKVVDYARKMNKLHPVLLPSTFPLAQQVAAGEILVGLGLNHSAQVPLRRGAPIKIVVAEPVPINTLFSSVPEKAKNPSGGTLLALWLATAEGAKVYEDATDRGNPFIPETKTYAVLHGHTVAQWPPDQAAQEAAAVTRINKMIESRETE
jgi:iron(III) transport system substrate-binding protein